MDDYTLEVTRVGEKYPQWVYPDVLVQIHYYNPHWELVIGYPDITLEEIRELHHGSLQMGVAYINHCLFLLFKFGKIPWMDAPYEPRLHSEKMGFPLFGSGTGAILQLNIVDSANGEVKAMRQMGLGNLLSNRLHTLCRELQEQPFKESSYHWMVDKTYKKYPTSEDMLKEVSPQDIFMIITEQ